VITGDGSTIVSGSTAGGVAALYSTVSIADSMMVSNGNVGVNNSAPAYSLDVGGAIRVASNVGVGVAPLTTSGTVNVSGGYYVNGTQIGGTLLTLATYTGGPVANSVPSSNSTMTTVWSTAIPASAKGKAVNLSLFFNLYSTTAFTSGLSFDYGVYIDSSSVSYGESNSTHYVQTTTSTYALSSNGYITGTGGMHPYQPLVMPLYIPPSSSLLSIGIANATTQFPATLSANPGYTSNVTTSSGTSNTSNFIPQNTFSNTGVGSYTVPSTCSAGTVVGVYVYLWGSGGDNGFGPGGAGGFTSGFYSCAGGTVLNYIVGKSSSANGIRSIIYGGGGTSPSSYGGGFSGLFLGSNLVASNVIAIAGGGGGQGIFSSQNGGSGGYPTGGAPWNTGNSTYSTTVTGGTQTAGGASTGTSGGFQPAAQFLGANGGGNGDVGAGGGGGGGGGGGWYGGGAPENRQGGAGGSGYIGNVNGATGGIGLTANAITSNGVTATASSTAYPGGTTNVYYTGTYGQNAQSGLVVIIPATGVSAVNIGVTAKLLVT
jgi:hypothetical protein